MVLIDGARYGFLERLLGRQRIAVAQAALKEVRYWRSEDGEKQPIDLTGYIEAGHLEVASATAHEMGALLAHSPSGALGEGEMESLALVLARGDSFCTADGAARRAMMVLGIEDRWVALEDLLSQLDPPVAGPEAKYRRDTKHGPNRPTA